MKLRSMKFKISILYTLILGVILFAYSIILYTNLSYVIYRQADKDLRVKAAEIAKTIAAYSEIFEARQEIVPVSVRRALHIDEVEGEEFFQWPSIKKMDDAWQVKIQMLGIKQDYVVIYYPTGEVVEKSHNVTRAIGDVLRQHFEGVPQDKPLIKSGAMGDFHLRIITMPYYRWNRLQYIIQIASPLEQPLFLLKSKLKLIFYTIPVFLLLSSLIGRFLVNKMYVPIAKIAQTARTISTKDMSRRVTLKQPDDELRALVDGFNDMIQRLEMSFKYVEEFSSNVAHELKTPLAIIRGELELALRKSRSPEEYRRAIGVALDESQEMLKTINDLLLLAKLDYQAEIFKFEAVELCAFLAEVAEQSRAIAGQKNITVSFEPLECPVTIQADKLHLRRLFFNLVDNAVKYTPENGRVDIVISRSGREVRVAVSDTGVGIAKDNLPKIFDRFFHAASPQDAPSANGLGLSIVASIAKIHQGRVDVASEPGRGSTFTVILPVQVS